VNKQIRTPLWETKKIRVARRKNKAKRQYLKLKSPANKEKRRKAAKLLSQVIKEAVLNFESRIARNQDTKPFSHYVHSVAELPTLGDFSSYFQK